MDPDRHARHARLAAHQAHDAAALLRRWKSAARRARWRTLPLVTENGLSVLAVDSPGAVSAAGRTTPGLYASAGMHGDEPAPAWALLDWFEAHADRLADRPVALIPCFNPHGIAANTRVDHRGEDLNRQFHRLDHPLIAAWRTWLGQRPFALGLCLHEDYDARGTYCYELTHPGSPQLGNRLLDACSAVLPRESRSRIEGRRASRGLIRRTVPPTDLPGQPEAIALHFQYARHNLTFETPSEFCLLDRIHAHRLFLDTVLKEMGW